MNHPRAAEALRNFGYDPTLHQLVQGRPWPTKVVAADLLRVARAEGIPIKDGRVQRVGPSFANEGTIHRLMYAAEQDARERLLRERETRKVVDDAWDDLRV